MWVMWMVEKYDLIMLEIVVECCILEDLDGVYFVVLMFEVMFGLEGIIDVDFEGSVVFFVWLF